MAFVAMAGISGNSPLDPGKSHFMEGHQLLRSTAEEVFPNETALITAMYLFVRFVLYRAITIRNLSF